MRVAILTLGCKVNYYESEKIAREFAERGCDLVDPSEEADVVIVNTCTVTNIADRKSRQMLHRVRKKSPHAIVVAAGCYVERAGEPLQREPGVNLALSNKEKGELVDRVLSLWEKKQNREEAAAGTGDREGTHIAHNRTRAFIKVQDGCNQFCSYCLIPFVRGGGVLSSTPSDEVVREIRNYIKRGCTEVVLTGIHLSSYGVSSLRADGFVLEGGIRLQELIRQVQDIPGLQRIRLGSLEPRIISENWLEGLRKCDKLCPHFHLSLQSGCDATLSRMNRHYTTADYRAAVRLLRQFYEEPAITTDVIVGFPGETEEEFRQTVSFLDEIGFADIHVFQYSLRDGTRAASMPDQVPPREKKRRSEELLNCLNAWHERYRRSVEACEGKVLFEEYVRVGERDLLAGYDERYQRWGVGKEVAETHEWEPGQLASVDRHLFFHA